MTYCVAMSLDAGMIFASDSRTNAGVDQVGRFSKMRVFAREGDRIIVTLSSGNLSMTQSALNILEQRARSGDNQQQLWNATSMFDVARVLGDALREVKTRDGPYLAQNNIDSSANFLVGGIFSSVAVFALFIVVLLAAPQGLFGSSTARRV